MSAWSLPYAYGVAAVLLLTLYGPFSLTRVSVDSQARRFDDNVESFQNLQENLLDQGIDVRQLPLVLQYNKQDLPPDLILTPVELDDAFNFRAVPSVAADALHGTGVFETLKALSGLVLERLAARPPAA